MRQTLLFGVLEVVAFNSNRQNADLKLFEFGNCYFYNKENAGENPLNKYSQQEKLAIAVSGNRNPEWWNAKNEPISFYNLKASVENVLTRLGVDLQKVIVSGLQNELFAEGLSYAYNNVLIANLGSVSKKMKKQFDVKQDVYFADLSWDKILKATRKHKVEFVELPKYPEVRRDLSLLIDLGITFEELKNEALKVEKKLIKRISLFDVYEGKNLPEGKKSYAMSFILRDDTKTLNDSQIDKIMNSIIRQLGIKFGAAIR
jgi:phenylalanyl-tRNA synthetase beta chain